MKNLVLAALTAISVGACAAPPPPLPVTTGAPTTTVVPTSGPSPRPFIAKEVSFSLNSLWEQHDAEGKAHLDGWEVLTHLRRAGESGRTAVTISRSPRDTTMDVGVASWREKGNGWATMEAWQVDGKTVRRGSWSGILEGDVPGVGIDYLVEQKPYVYLISTRASSSLESDQIRGEVLALLASFKAAPVREPNYFPLSDGATWVYRMSLNGKVVGKSTTQAGVVEAADGVVKARVAVTTEAQDAAGQSLTAKAIATYRKTADELLYETADGTRRIELGLPLAKGKAWKDAGLDVVVEAEETLSVPYKKDVKALKVVAKVGQTIVATNWYAPDLGLVRGEAPDGRGNITVLELESYRYYMFSDARPDGDNPIH